LGWPAPLASFRGPARDLLPKQGKGGVNQVLSPPGKERRINPVAAASLDL